MGGYPSTHKATAPSANATMIPARKARRDSGVCGDGSWFMRHCYRNVFSWLVDTCNSPMDSEH